MVSRRTLLGSIAAFLGLSSLGAAASPAQPRSRFTLFGKWTNPSMNPPICVDLSEVVAVYVGAHEDATTLVLRGGGSVRVAESTHEVMMQLGQPIPEGNHQKVQ